MTREEIKAACKAAFDAGRRAERYDTTKHIRARAKGQRDQAKSVESESNFAAQIWDVRADELEIVATDLEQEQHLPGDRPCSS